MFCTKCGKEINDQAVVCVHCGCLVENGNHGGYASVSNMTAGTETAEKSTLAVLSFVFAFLMPIVGFVLGIVGAIKYKNRKYKNLSVIAIPLSIVAWIIYIVMFNSLFY